MPLIDHHCHGVVDTNLQPDEVRWLGTESDWLANPGVETLDSPLGLAMRALCAPLIGLPKHAPVQDYLTRRVELGTAAVNELLLAAAGTGRYLIDSGFLVSDVLSPQQMATLTGKPADEIVRLERIAEQVAAESTASGWVRAFREALTEQAEGAVGFKSVMAYRSGFELHDAAPEPSSVQRAVDEWFANGTTRLQHPVVLAHLVWEAVQFGKPIQFHTGFGDSDLVLHLSDPSRLTKFFVATKDSGVDFMLLHCYPFLREAGSLAHIFPHVYLDAGVTGHYLGPSAGTAVRQSMEIAPFHKICYSSDAYGLAELYAISAAAWRRETGRLLDQWLAGDWLSTADAERIAWQIGVGNAARVYGVDEQ
ncbi:hypothetical protein BVC93_27280 [Mycobacterium sp. MS1601]|nr:hypothetical protein BVC93_27280 [Mycobacterium sp. MS1601]